MKSSKKLLIVFVKNSQLGHVKTRLAKTIGEQAAFEVYQELVAITEEQTSLVEEVDVHIYFSKEIVEEQWPEHLKFVQEGSDLGARMQNAFQYGFDLGYTQIIGVGSDLPDLSAELMKEGLDSLENSTTVFGPAEDGGYYLIGMNQMVNCVFENKEWSTESLLSSTLKELTQKDISHSTLKTLNDIDNLEDLKASSVSHKFKHYYELS